MAASNPRKILHPYFSSCRSSNGIFQVPGPKPISINITVFQDFVTVQHATLPTHIYIYSICSTCYTDKPASCFISVYLWISQHNVRHMHLHTIYYRHAYIYIIYATYNTSSMQQSMYTAIYLWLYNVLYSIRGGAVPEQNMISYYGLIGHHKYIGLVCTEVG
jgi:hypothetical protein